MVAWDREKKGTIVFYVANFLSPLLVLRRLGKEYIPFVFVGYTL